MSLSSSDETCNGNDGTVVATISDCAMENTLSPEMQNFLWALSQVTQMNSYGAEWCMQGDYSMCMSWMMDLGYILDDPIDPYMLAAELQALVTNFDGLNLTYNNDLSPEMQKFLWDLSQVTQMYSYEAESCMQGDYYMCMYWMMTFI